MIICAPAEGFAAFLQGTLGQLRRGHWRRQGADGVSCDKIAPDWQGWRDWLDAILALILHKFGTLLVILASFCLSATLGGVAYVEHIQGLSHISSVNINDSSTWSHHC